MIKFDYAGMEFVIVTAKTAKDNEFSGTQYKDYITGQDLVISFADDAVFFDANYEEEKVIEHPSLIYYAIRKSCKTMIANAMYQVFDTVTPSRLSSDIEDILYAVNYDNRDEVRKGITDAIYDIKNALRPLT